MVVAFAEFFRTRRAAIDERVSAKTACRAVSYRKNRRRVAPFRLSAAAPSFMVAAARAPDPAERLSPIWRGVR